MSTNVKIVGAFEAKTKFSELLSRVAETGAEFVITKHDQPVARLVPEEEVPFAGGSGKGPGGVATTAQAMPAWKPQDKGFDQRRPAMNPEFVLDGSLTMAWCFEDVTLPQSDEIQDWLATGARAYVPTLWHLEVANVLWACERDSNALRKRIARTFWPFSPP